MNIIAEVLAARRQVIDMAKDPQGADASASTPAFLRKGSRVILSRRSQELVMEQLMHAWAQAEEASEYVKKSSAAGTPGGGSASTLAEPAEPKQLTAA